MKASPVRLGDYIEFLAEIDLLGAFSTCKGGDCRSEHSSVTVACYTLNVEIHRHDPKALVGWATAVPSAIKELVQNRMICKNTIGTGMAQMIFGSIRVERAVF